MQVTGYDVILQQLAALTADCALPMPAMANCAALLREHLPNLNWAGFYVMHHGKLVLGPFQGKVACVEIALGRGVCGTAAQERRTVIVPDVHAFPGHIACDSASASEVVIPLVKEGRLLGVMDLDSPLQGRFTPDDARQLEDVCTLLLGRTEWGEDMR